MGKRIICGCVVLGIVACLIGCQKSDNYELMKESKQQVLPIYEKKDAEVQGEKCALETLQDVYKSDYILEEWKIEKIGEPGGIFCNDEAVLISDKKTDCIFEVDYAGNILKEVGGTGSGEGEFISPSAITMCNEKIYVLDQGNNRIQVLDKELDYIEEIKLKNTQSTDPNYIPEVLSVNQESIYVTGVSLENPVVDKYTDGKLKEIGSNFIGSIYSCNNQIYLINSMVTFKGMEDSFQVDWLSRTFNTIKLDKEISYSISAFYEESFPEWENQYVSIKGIDESYFYPLPKIEGRTFSKNELQEGKDVCLMNKQYARMHACEIGDMIQIRDKRLKVIGLIDNSVYSGMIIPYQTMLNVYKEEKDIQFSGTFFCENELQKQKRIDEVIEQIKEKDNHADILGVTEGEELYKNALYTKIQWRIVRGMCALVAILFFMINETIVLMAKAKKERKIMGINLALGATERDIKYCLFFETLLVTLLAVFLVMITLRPLAKLASLEHIIILDSMVIVETVILAVWACEILTWIIVSRIKKENIADMVRTTRDI